MAEPKRLGDFGARLTAKLREVRETHEALGEVVAEAAEAEETELGAVCKHLRNCGFPEKSVRWIEANGLDGLRAWHCGKQLLDFMRSSHLVAVLEGGVGSGKTTLSALAFLEAKKPKVAGYDAATGKMTYRDEYDAEACHFFQASKLKRLHEGWSEARPVIEALEKAPILILDDVATSDEDAARVVELVQGVLIERDAWCRKTIITTNSNAEQLKARYRERVADRLDAEAVVISCGMKSRRVAS